ncbi:DNA recombination protein RmuC [Denitrobaculum tricleocarpae]|uniref:DNA recombination protein RmuC homolog n=2 Tax=Denitrobaculum tricleocarpae TaxID=2591009 RepID=A0A545U1C2_9PROT|nr:DNA recombination protein RmuC [Denitrobaculum tricleocarpae]
MDMDLTLVALVIAALAVAALCFCVFAMISMRKAAEKDGRDGVEFTGRISQLTETLAATQAQTADRFQAQERAIGKLLEERLGDLTKRVGDRLQDHATRNQTALGALGERLAVIDQAQKNITELSSQVVGLQDILANKQARGAFGEVQLSDIVTSILPPSAYSFQATIGENRRVDCLLHLPNPPGSIAIDSKFPLESYQALQEAKDDAASLQARRTFVADVRKHVKDIAERYIVAGETAESALMFLPSEAVYAELHANFRNVVEDSYRARVWIVSPTTLMATLNTVRAVLKDVRMREQAGVIQSEVQKMMLDVGRLDDRVDKLQRHFQQADRDIRDIRTSADKITKRGERIEELQLEDAEDDAAELPPPAQPRLVVD